MAANKEMSEWIKFFTAAGIPAGPGAKYALVFIDNRIQKSMLMDLTKEYLKEMGIAVMGDIIAILKYAKTAHTRYENEKPAMAAMAVAPDAKVELKRQTTPGNRMLEHYMRKEGIMEGGSSKVTVSPSMAVRLGAVPLAGAKKETGSINETAAVVPVKRPRIVKPEEEGAYIISMPTGSTPKTQKILEQKQASSEDKKSSVFSRLGSGNSGSATPPAKKKLEASPAEHQSQQGGSSVFNRLGDQRNQMKSGGSETGSVVKYQGVLKSSLAPAEVPTRVIPKPSTIKTTKPTMNVALGVKTLMATKTNLQTRLGAPSTTPKGVTSTAGVKPKVTVTLGGVKKNALSMPKQSLMDRLGVQKAEVSTTSSHMDHIGVKSRVQERLGSGQGDAGAVQVKQSVVKLNTHKPAVRKSMQDRLGAPANPSSLMVPSGVTRQGAVKQTVTVTIGGKPSSMQNRLGKQVPVNKSATATIKSPAANAKILKRVGSLVSSPVPEKKSNLQDRLGGMRAEVTSTTPHFTITTGGAGSGKKRVASVNRMTVQSGASGKNVFSRLGS